MRNLKGWPAHRARVGRWLRRSAAGRVSRHPHHANPAAGQEGKPMSDSRTVTIPAADHAAPAQTRPVRLLRALAHNPGPLSAPPWPASWPSQAAAAGCCPPTTGPCAGTSRPATSNEPATNATDAAARRHLAHHPRRPPLARRPRQRTSPRRGRRRPSTPHSRRTGPGLTKPAPPSTLRLRGSAANAPLTNSENSAPPSTRSARSSTSAKKESARTSSGTRPHANPPENPSHPPASAKPNSS